MTREQRKRPSRRDALFAALALALAAAIGGAFAAEAVASEAKGPQETAEDLAYHQKAMGEVQEYAWADTHQQWEETYSMIKEAHEAYIDETIRLEDERIEAALLEQGYYREDVPLDFVYQDILQTACEAREVPYELALAVIERESGFDVDAVGPDGHDVGLFQIRESNHEWLRSETGADPETPEGNILCGVWFLAYLYDYCGGDWEAALTCWRWGPGNGEKSDYAAAVLEAAENWSKNSGICSFFKLWEG